MDGILIKKNKQGHTVIRLHYTADPDKNPGKAGKEWFDQESRKYIGGVTDLKWRREMEIDFSAGSGELVFPSFMELENEIVVEPFAPSPTWAYYAGLDWGTRNPTSFHVYAIDPDGNVYCVWELYGAGMTVKTVAEGIKTCPFYASLEWIACDPTMFSTTVIKKDGFTSIIEMLSDSESVGQYTIDKLMPAHNRSDESMINLMQQMFATRPIKFKIFNTCPFIINEYRNLKRPERKGFVNETEKIVDKDNHAWDDSKYFFLSHPVGYGQQTFIKRDTIEYINKITQMAEMAARNKGTSVQEEFNYLYGQDIE